MYDPQPKRHAIGFIPHYWHGAGLDGGKGLEGVKVIDVCQSVESVAGELSSCQVVVSTSLHGIVAAHAYGIPWVWAKMDPALVGDEFKFRDFLQGMRISADPVHVSQEEIDRGCLVDLARHARLPEGDDVRGKQRDLLFALRSSLALAGHSLKKSARLGPGHLAVAVGIGSIYSSWLSDFAA
jgi:hypothetical protein